MKIFEKLFRREKVMCWRCMKEMELFQTNAQQQEAMCRQAAEEHTTLPRSFGCDLGDLYRCPKCGGEKWVGGMFSDV